MTQPLTILLTYDFDPALVEQMRAVDPRIRVEALSRPERILLRGGELSEAESTDDLRATLASKLAETDVILGWPDVTEDLLQRAPRLRWIHVSSAGVDELLGNAAFESGRITVTNSSGVSAVAIGEYILCTMLMLAKRQPRFIRQQTEQRWQRHRTSELAGKTLGIVGLGAIGEEAARRARAFEMRLLAIRRSATEPASTELIDRLLPPSSLPELLAESDYVALTVPLTHETDGLIGEEELRQMKPSAYLINISRGQVIDQGALVRALQEGWIAGAALDVFDPEPLPSESPLWQMEQVIITPHISGVAERQNERITAIFCDNLRRYLAGQLLHNLVDPKLGY
jgi:phosphoglycerate dehydrogenase-like enzyme